MPHLAPVVGAILASMTITAANACDWPMWRYDAGRGGATPEELPAELHLQWTRQLPPNQPAWPDTQPMLQFDAVPQPVVLGKLIFVPSSTTDTLTAFNTENGEEVWRFYADGPIRLAPATGEGRVYCVSDDGHLYCLDAADGDLLWKVRGGPAERWILGNERLISSWPARGGPVLHDGKVYFTAGIWPFMGIFIHAVDAQSGKITWTNSGDGTNWTQQPHNGAISFAGVCPQGHLAIDGDYLIVPGGRSTPGVFDLKTGKLVHFAFDKRFGGHAVFARKGVYFAGGRIYATADGTPLNVAEPSVITDDLLLFGRGGRLQGFSFAGVQLKKEMDKRGEEFETKTFDSKPLFDVETKDAPSTVFLKAGSRVYTGGDDKVAAIEVEDEARRGQVVWQEKLDHEVMAMVAGNDRLFTISENGQLSCFGAVRKEPSEVVNWTLEEGPFEFPDPTSALIRHAACEGGYVVFLGISSWERVSEFHVRFQNRTGPRLSKPAFVYRDPGLHVIAVDDNPKRIGVLRLVSRIEGTYGRRRGISGIARKPLEFPFPPYLANVVVCENPAGVGLLADSSNVRIVYQMLRPCGGRLVAEMADHDHERFAGLVAEAKLVDAQLKRKAEDGITTLTRTGPPPDTDDWTHEYGNAAQSGINDERLVKAPLGVLWFGGPSHEGILPRHGHGPAPQVAAGRLFIEGADLIRCLDIYTGRLIWEKSLPGVGKYYDTTAHFAGAGEIGSNYVSLADRVYVVYGREILELDAATGETLKSFIGQDEPRGVGVEGDASPYFGFLAVEGDFLVATAAPLDVPPAESDALSFAPLLKLIFDSAKKRAAEMKALPDDKKDPPGGLAETQYSSGSRRLMVFDRKSGKLLWQREAEFNFRHNSIAVAAGKVFCIDGLTDEKLQTLKKRGVEFRGTPKLFALDAATGDVLWSVEQPVFGTFLNYSAEHDILVQAGSHYRDRAKDEVKTGIAAFGGADGKLLWHKPIEHGGPCLLRQDQIITNGGGGFALHIKTGEPTGWKYERTYGCNTAHGCQNLLTFRSGAAGFLDLAGDSGTGNLGGFRSSCTNNLIPAGGVLSAPDYTRTCTCAYQLQTSLALVHMPEAEFWTFGAKPTPGRLGINFGAPGDRRDDNGTLWLEWPDVGGNSEKIEIKVEPADCETFRMHSSQISGATDKMLGATGGLPARSETSGATGSLPARDDETKNDSLADKQPVPPEDSLADKQPVPPISWVAASGLRGVKRIVLPAKNGRRYTVRLHFMEPEDLTARQRVFDVSLQDQIVLDDFDVTREAGAARRAIVREFVASAAESGIVIELSPVTGEPPVISGVEWIEARP